MNAYENNHYIPQFILRRYSDSINLYDIQDLTLQQNMWTSRVFAKKNIYPVDLEKDIGTKLEAPFSKLLSEKLMTGKIGETLTLTRKELMLMKRFYILETVRTTSMQKVIGAYAELKEILPREFSFMEKKIENETVEDRWRRNIRVIVETEDINKIWEHPLCTYDIAMWTRIIQSGYFAIWDCCESNVDFIISDAGITSEVEPSKVLNGFEVEKKNELVRLIDREHILFNRDRLITLLSAQMLFHENFYMFPLSKNRMIVTINPFFSLYRSKEKLPESIIWPSQIKNKRLFTKNISPKLQMVFGKPVLNDDDEFIYTIQGLSQTDAEYVNMLMLDRVERYMGFADWEKIKSSVERYIEFHKEIGMVPPINYKPLIDINGKPSQ
jgi:hypothetical protein